MLCVVTACCFVVLFALPSIHHALSRPISQVLGWMRLNSHRYPFLHASFLHTTKERKRYNDTHTLFCPIINMSDNKWFWEKTFRIRKDCILENLCLADTDIMFSGFSCTFVFAMLPKVYYCLHHPLETRHACVYKYWKNERNIRLHQRWLLCGLYSLHVSVFPLKLIIDGVCMCAVSEFLGLHHPCIQFRLCHTFIVKWYEVIHVMIQSILPLHLPMYIEYDDRAFQFWFEQFSFISMSDPDKSGFVQVFN